MGRENTKWNEVCYVFVSVWLSFLTFLLKCFPYMAEVLTESIGGDTAQILESFMFPYLFFFIPCFLFILLFFPNNIAVQQLFLPGCDVHLLIKSCLLFSTSMSLVSSDLKWKEINRLFWVFSIRLILHCFASAMFNWCKFFSVFVFFL